MAGDERVKSVGREEKRKRGREKRGKRGTKCEEDLISARHLL
jgi:hypothetical protein